MTQHYDTLQSIGEETNSNLILLPNSPQAGSDMLNNMVASFSASNQIGEAMKKENKKRNIYRCCVNFVKTIYKKMTKSQLQKLVVYINNIIVKTTTGTDSAGL